MLYDQELKRLRKTIREGDSTISWEEIEQIPEDLLACFGHESYANDFFLRRIRDNSDLKYGLLKNDEILGFATGNYSGNVIIVHSIFVDNRFRRMGLASRLLQRITRRAKEEGLNGVTISQMNYRSKAVLDSLIGSEGLEISTKLFSPGNYGFISFPRI